MRATEVTILTNFQRFPERWRAHGVEGRGIMVNTVREFLRHARACDLIIINCDVDLVMRLAACFRLFPWLRRPILAHDAVLRQPKSLRARLLAPVKRLLLTQVDHFTHHFYDLDGYRKYYGIGPDRSSYLPSKPNIRYRYRYNVSPEGEYILCFGRSERDYDTFFAAMERLPYPGAIPPPDFAQFRKHSTRFSRPLSELPPNVRTLEDDGTVESLIRLIERARLVVLPIVGSKIAPSGIGTYLNAMLMGKCVILTKGPAVSDVLQDEALIVPAENPEALATAIRRAWEDDDLRRRTAAAGQRYAESCGGEPELRQRVIEAAVKALYLPGRKTATAQPGHR
ncbi:MAG: glycosyltransferase family 4 protein [Acidobacteria bacterium]|nr:glycosyltransferase family 4 protein [Acidobacteriota bacterium]